MVVEMGTLWNLEEKINIKNAKKNAFWNLKNIMCGDIIIVP